LKREQFPGTNLYVFELTLGINSALMFSAGALSTLVLDGLFALEEQDLLFPGVTEPEDRLRIASMDAIGYERSGRSSPIGDADRRLLADPRDLPKGQRDLKGRLDEALAKMEAVILRQHMLVAKMVGLGDGSLHPAGSSAGEQAKVEELIAAAEAIAAAVEVATKPVL
jgi:hypothetical protein